MFPNKCYISQEKQAEVRQSLEQASIDLVNMQVWKMRFVSVKDCSDKQVKKKKERGGRQQLCELTNHLKMLSLLLWKCSADEYRRRNDPVWTGKERIPSKIEPSSTTSAARKFKDSLFFFFLGGGGQSTNTKTVLTKANGNRPGNHLASKRIQIHNATVQMFNPCWTATLASLPRTSQVARVRNSRTKVLESNTEMTVQIPLTARYRRERTIRSAMLHHGATTADTLPAAHGLWLALLHAASTKTLKMLLRGSNKAMLCISQIVREEKEKTAFEMSTHNKVHSVGLLYSGSVMSKAKYRKCYSSLVRRYDRRRKKKVPLEIADGMRVDKPLSYDKL